MTTATKTLTTTITVDATGETLVAEHDNMVAAHRYLDRVAVTRGWFWSKHKVAANQWEGRFVQAHPRNLGDRTATFAIAK